MFDFWAFTAVPEPNEFYQCWFSKNTVQHERSFFFCTFQVSFKVSRLLFIVIFFNYSVFQCLTLLSFILNGPALVGPGWQLLIIQQSKRLKLITPNHVNNKSGTAGEVKVHTRTCSRSQVPTSRYLLLSGFYGSSRTSQMCQIIVH